MLHTLAAEVVLAANAATGLSIDNPLVLGPIAAFIFTIFVSEVVVSGKAYRRMEAENARLRGIVEKVIPLSETMVTATQSLTAAISQTADKITATVAHLDRIEEKLDSVDRPPRRQR